MRGVWPFSSSSEFLGVPEDSKFPLLGVWASPSHLAQSGVATFMFQELSNYVNKIFNPMSFDLHNCLQKIWESIEISTPKVGIHLRLWGFIPSHFPTFSGA
jgi:hypothetical protein